MRLACAVVLLAMSLLIMSCGKQDVPTVYVVSPHASDIRLEFTRAFAAWHKQKYGFEVTIKWPDYGGTSDIERYLGTQYIDKAKDSCGWDVFFGGGSATFNKAAGNRFLERAPISDEARAAAVQSRPAITLRGPDDIWFAATMSNFGIVINKVRIRELGLTEPRTWEDLAGPQWLGQLSLADPSKSGSVKTAYENMIQQNGWGKGWGMLALMFANADAVKDSGSAPAEETDLGNAAAGIVIDFFARNHITKQGPDVIGFVVPKGGSALDADPIAMLRGAPHPVLAAHLIEFVISPEGQKIWTFKAGTPGGPAFKPLGRLSVHESLYKDFPQYLFDPMNPFEQSGGFKLDDAAQKARSAFLGDLMKAAFIDNHPDLVAARTAAKRAGDKPQTLAVLTALPRFSIPQKDLADPPASAPEKLRKSIAALQTAVKKAGHAEALATGLQDCELTGEYLEILARYYMVDDGATQARVRNDLTTAWRRDYAARCERVKANP